MVYRAARGRLRENKFPTSIMISVISEEHIPFPFHYKNI